MPLPNYGLLTGKLLGHGEQHGGNPHYLLNIQAGSISYRVAVNLESTLSEKDAPPELQFQIIADLRKGNSKAKALAARVSNRNQFVLANQENPGCDFVHDGVLDMGSFRTLPRGTPADHNPFSAALVAAANRAKGDAGTYLAVFGTGYTADRSGPGTRASFGFSGVDNVHMNQGSFYSIDGHLNNHFEENGPHQDGAVLFFFSDGTVQGFFTKFQSQDSDTDSHGNPVHTNVDELNDTPAAAAKTLTSGVAKRKKKAAAMLAAGASVHGHHFKAASKHPAKSGKKKKTPAAGGTPPTPPLGTFVFNDPTGSADPMHPFKTDDDSNVDQNFVDQFAKHGVPEPVPGPRDGKYPTISLSDILGASAVSDIQKTGQIVIHAVGDTGAPEEKKLPHELNVSQMMMKDFAGDPAGHPAFFYHLGDVVYYFGEENYYYDQFFRPYREYPRPIFAIPGNHDGITYSKDMKSLAPFIKAFCDSAPDHWAAAGGISRTTMTQPGVYFTLDAPFVSVIGLYSNCSESYGYLDDQQTLFLYNELVRLKPKRASGEISAVLLAVDHPPMSYSASKPASQALRNDIDKAATQAGLWPDAIFSGHAHVYQRMTRTVAVSGKNRDIPHLVCGAGGYNLSPTQEVDKADMKVADASDPQFHLHKFLLHYGYMKLTITPTKGNKNGTLQVDFLSPNIVSGGPADTFTLDLETHRILD